MKILIVGDLHIGVKGDDPWHESITVDAFKQAVAYSKAHGITQWIQAGDWFDVRKAVTQRTMQFIRTKITPMLVEAGIICYITIGNHDLMLRDKIHPNSVTEILGNDPTYVAIDKPTTVNFEGLDIDLIPWLCKENSEEIFSFIKQTTSPWCVGHWELNGFMFYKNTPSSGYEPDFLKGYEKVVSGHFHTQSDGSNVHYIGTPYTITAGDEDDPRGFWVLDTETRDFDFIPNTTTWHARVLYPGVTPEQIKSYTNCSVRLVARQVDAGLTKVEHLLSRVVHDLRTINKAVKIEVDTSVDDEADPAMPTIQVNADASEVELKSVMGLLEEQVEKSDLNEVDKEAIIRFANELHIEATC